MERYTILEELGDGTCGCVYKAFNMETYEIVAVKKMKRKFYFWEECMNLREVKALCKLNHPNIIKLKEVVRENNELFFIFEYMVHNLYQIMREREGPFSVAEIRSFMSQMLHGLAHMHKNGYFHRDLKPENLLVTNDVLKIADFGLAREVSSMPPYTEYVSTRWYRAPEVLLQSSSYTPAIDMWAVGAILAELFTSSPIFPGESEADQLYKICLVLGTPDWTVFPEAKNIFRLINISYSEIFPTNLSDIIPNASSEAIDLIKQLCSWDPRRRPTAEQALQHPFFNVGAWYYPLRDPLELRLNNMETPNLELNLWDFDTEPDDCFLGLTLAVKPSVPNLELVHNESQRIGENILFCSGLKDHPEQSGNAMFLTLIPLLPVGEFSFEVILFIVTMMMTIPCIWCLPFISCGSSILQFFGHCCLLIRMELRHQLNLPCRCHSAVQFSIQQLEFHSQPGSQLHRSSPISWNIHFGHVLPLPARSLSVIELIGVI